MQNLLSDQLIAGRAARDQWVEQMLFTVYGSPALQGALGLNLDARAHLLLASGQQKDAFCARKMTEFRSRMGEGGFNAALVRAALYVVSTVRELDEHVAQSLNDARQRLTHLSHEAFKALVREQFYILLLEREAAVDAIAALVPDAAQRQELVTAVAHIAAADGSYTLAERRRVERLATLLAVTPPQMAPLPLVAGSIG